MYRLGSYDINTNPGTILGQGNYGIVYPCERNGVLFAVKCIKPKKKESSWENIEKEMETIKGASGHPNILSVIEDIVTEKSGKKMLWMFMDYCDLGDLDKYAEDYRLELNHKVHIMQQTASGLAYLHKPRPVIIHRDLKPQNIFLKSTNGLHLLKIGEFGLSRLMGTTLQQMRTFAGTPNYLGPEFFDKDFHDEDFIYDVKVDVHAAGITFFQLLQAEQGMGMEVDEVLEQFLGKIMQDKRRAGERWNPVEIDAAKDSKKVQRLKKILQSMVVFSARQRPSMLKVEKDLKMLQPETPAIPQNYPERASGDAMSDPPALPTRKPSIKKLLTHDTPYMYDDRINMSEYAFFTDGVLVEPLKQAQYIKLKLQTDPALSYTNEWEKPRPNGKDIKRALHSVGQVDGVEKNSDKYFLDDGRIIIRHDNDGTTFVFGSDLKCLATFTGDYGLLCGTLSADMFCYHKEREDDEGQVDVYRASKHEKVTTFSQPVNKCGGISIIRHKTGGWIGVTDCYGETLGIYRPDLSHHKRVSLGFQPGFMNAVPLMGDYIIIHQHWSNWLHVLNWEGQELSKLQVKGHIMGLGPTREGFLQVATEDAIHLYTIE